MWVRSGTLTISGFGGNGPYDEQMRPNPVEASASRSGVAATDRVESGRWHVANKGTNIAKNCT